MLLSSLFSFLVQSLLLTISFVSKHLANSQKFLGPQLNSEISVTLFLKKHTHTHTISKTSVLILKPDSSAALNLAPGLGYKRQAQM